MCLFVCLFGCLPACLPALLHSESSDIRKKISWIVHKNQACNLRCIYMRLNAYVCVCVSFCECVSRFGNLYTIKSDYMSTSYGQRIPRDFDNKM